MPKPGLGEQTKATAKKKSGGKANRFQVWEGQNRNDDSDGPPASAIG